MKLNIVKTAIAAAALLSTSVVAQAAEVTLTMSHFLSPKAPPHAKFLEPWARKIEAESNGRIKIEIFPSMTLGGKPPELYRQLRDGAADIVWTLTGYTPGVFPRVEVFELPGVHGGSAKATTLAIQDNFGLVADDFKDIKPLLVHVHAGQAIHLVNGCIDGVQDLKGMKLRTPSRTGGWMISSWGAEPVGMPVPALPQALSKGVVDGALIPFEIVPPFKVHELTKCSVVGVNGSRFGTSVFLFAMNKDRYDSLPADLKAIIDANSGMAIAEQAGTLWDEIEAPGQMLQKKTGSPVKELDQAATDGFAKLSGAVTAKWVEEAGKVGIDANALVKAAKASVASHSN
jgi:TRAP-type C4-dicarboxylate transport system substrate-binding protein